jgi:hypothetical protein
MLLRFICAGNIFFLMLQPCLTSAVVLPCSGLLPFFFILFFVFIGGLLIDFFQERLFLRLRGPAGSSLYLLVGVVPVDIVGVGDKCLAKEVEDKHALRPNGTQLSFV